MVVRSETSSPFLNVNDILRCNLVGEIAFLVNTATLRSTLFQNEVNWQEKGIYTYTARSPFE